VAGHLGSAVQPQPVPPPIVGAPFVESGAYRLIRHPIYTGPVVGAFGWGLVTGSILAIATAGLLFLLFAGKSAARRPCWQPSIPSTAPTSDERSGSSRGSTSGPEAPARLTVGAGLGIFLVAIGAGLIGRWRV
jgi:hypothetical protein